MRYVFILLIFACAAFTGGTLQAETPQPPLWRAGQYFGGVPNAEKYLTRGIYFRISPDKVTMKDINIAFPADFHDEAGNISARNVRFSQTGIEPLTLQRTSRTQSFFFAYLDEFDNNWNTELRITWNRSRQRFKIFINAQSDPIEGTFYKASALIASGAVRGRLPSGE